MKRFFAILLSLVMVFLLAAPAFAAPTELTLAVYYTCEEEKRLAEARIRELEAGSGKKVYVALEPFTAFYPAEEYHQDYYRKHPDEFERELIESGRKR